MTVRDPGSTWIDLQATIAEDVELLPGTMLIGPTVIERGAIIGPDTSLDSCEVGAGATVRRTDATLAVIGAGASVGPFAYLRPGTYLGENGKIGTFVETKNSTIGRGSKVPHLSYVGDTTIGEDTNLGAVRSRPITTTSTSTRRSSGHTCTRVRTPCSSPRLELVTEPRLGPARSSARTFHRARWPSLLLRSAT